MGIRTQVDIDPTALGITWAPGTQYRIAIEEGFMVEDGGDQQPSPAVSSLLAFTTNSTGPSLSSSTPSSGATGVSSSIVTLTFNRNIIINSGTIKLYQVGTIDILAKTFNISDSQITISGNTITVDCTGFVEVGLTTYYLLLDAGIVKDFDNFNSVAVSDANTIRWTAVENPGLNSSSPTNNATNVQPKNLSLTFSRNMIKGTGFIKFYKVSDNTLAYSVDVTTSAVSISNAVVSVDMEYQLTAATQYYVLIDSTALKDVNGFFYPGISSNSTLRFTTTLIGQVIGINSESTLFRNVGALAGSLTFNFATGTVLTATTANTTNNTKGLQLYKVVSGGDTLIRTFYNNKTAPAGATRAGSAELTVSNTSMVVYCASYMEDNASYYFLLEEGAYTSGSLTVPAITNKTKLAINTNISIANLVDKSYTGNTTTTTIGNSGGTYIRSVDPTTQFTITLTSPIGRFYNTTSDVSSTWTLTDTKDNINGYFTANVIRFIPNYNTSTTSTYSVSLSKLSTSYGSQTKAMTYSGSTSSIDIVSYNTPGDYTWTLSDAEKLYFTKADILLVGPGRGGHEDWAGPSPAADTTGGGGGGAGGVVELTNQNILSSSSYTLKVATGYPKWAYGGGTTESGNNTTGFGYTAYQGTNVVTSASNPATAGGNVGQPQTFTGGSGPYGGGAGAGGNGGAGADTSAGTSNGGAGYYSTILGQYVAYGGNGYNGTVRTEYGSGGNGGTGAVSATNGRGGIIYIKLKP